MIEAGVGDLGQRIRDDQAQVGYLMAGQSGGWMTPCVIRIVHVEEAEVRVSRFSLKIGGDSLPVVWPQNHRGGFLVWASKPSSTV
jgi:hypothetical protein